MPKIYHYLGLPSFGCVVTLRDIPLDDNTVAALKNWRAEPESDPVGKASEFIFYSADGSVMNENQFNSLWRRFISSLGWFGKGFLKKII